MAVQQGRLRDWLVVVLLMCTMIVSFVDRFTLALLIEPIKHDLDLNDVQLGLLNGVAFGLFYATMGMPLGWLADRWSRKYTIVLGMGIWSIATAACGLASGFGQLAVARIGVGAGEAGLAPASYGIIYDRFPNNKLGRAMSLLQIGSLVGAGCAMLVAGAIYTYYLAGHGAGIPLFGQFKPWQQTFVTVALPPLILLPMVAMLREPRPSRHDIGKAGEERMSLRTALMLKPSVYALLFLGMSGIITATYALLSWTSAIMFREFGWSPGDVGKTYGVITIVAGPLGLLLGGWLADTLYLRGSKLAHAYIPLLAACCALPPALLLPTVHGAGAFLIVVALLQTAVGMPIGVVPALIQLLTPASARGQVSALYVLTLNAIGLGLAPTVIGALSQRAIGNSHGLRVAISQVIITALISASFLLLLLVRKLSADAVFGKRVEPCRAK